MQCACALLSSVAYLLYIFPHYLINGTIKKKVMKHKMCLLISSTSYVWNISHARKNWVRCSKTSSGLHVEYPLFLSYFNKTWIFLNSFFEKYSNIKIHGNPSSGGRVVPCGQTDGGTNMSNLIGAFRNFANAHKNANQEHAKCAKKFDRLRVWLHLSILNLHDYLQQSNLDKLVTFKSTMLNP